MTGSDQRARDTTVALADTFVALADLPIDEFDSIDFLDMLTECCVELLGVTTAGLLLVDHHGTLNLVGASSEQVRLLEQFQLRNREGPCLDCYHSRQPVWCSDLAVAPARWPRFATTDEWSNNSRPHSTAVCSSSRPRKCWPNACRSP